MIAMGATNLPERAMRQQIAAAIQIVMQQSRLSDGSRRVNSLHRVFVPGRESRSEGFVPAGNLGQAEIESVAVEGPLDAEHALRVVGGAVRLPLAQKPETRLAERKRRRAVGRPRPDRLRFAVAAFRPQPLFEQRALGRRQRVDLRLEVAHATRTRDEARRDPRAR